ncbi:unnamed protein product [Musa acuminata var. zebrina]
MGNYCAVPADPERKRKAGRNKKLTRLNPFSIDYHRGLVLGLVVLMNPTGRDIDNRYELG